MGHTNCHGIFLQVSNQNVLVSDMTYTLEDCRFPGKVDGFCSDGSGQGYLQCAGRKRVHRHILSHCVFQVSIDHSKPHNDL